MKKGCLLICSLVLVTFLGCKKPQGFEYREIRNFRLGALGLDKSTVAMDLVYFNPNSYGMDLKHVDCDVYLDSSHLGKFILDTTMHIAPKSEFSLPSQMQIDMRVLFQNAFSLFVTQEREVQINVKGTTKVGKAGVYFNVPFTYSGKHKLTF